MPSEKEALRGFLLTWAEWRGWARHLGDHVIEPIRTTQSVRGLRMAARDAAEEFQDLSAAELAEIDGLLAERGFPTLTQMANRSFRELRAVLDRGRLRNDDEFRLLEAYLSDVDSPALSESDRSLANSMLADFSDPE